MLKHRATQTHLTQSQTFGILLNSSNYAIKQNICLQNNERIINVVLTEKKESFKRMSWKYDAKQLIIRAKSEYLKMFTTR